jgi:hypothetical protein
MIKKVSVFFFLKLVLNIYSTFVLTILWRWFVVPALHVPDISFWIMYGLVLTIALFQNYPNRNLTEERRWESALTMIRSAVPENRKALVEEELEAIKPSEWEIWFDGAVDLVGRALTCTFTLAVGFVVHSLA